MVPSSSPLRSHWHSSFGWASKPVIKHGLPLEAPMRFGAQLGSHRLAWSRTTPFSASGGFAFGGHGINTQYMKYHLYIIENSKKTKKYIGITVNIGNRLKEHNRGEVKSTKPYGPWYLVHTEMFETKTLARKRELYLKKNYQERKKIFSVIG